MCEANEQAETEELMARDYELPFIYEDDFNYYPETSELPYNECMASTQESLVLGRGMKRMRLVKKKQWDEFWLEKVVLKLKKRFRLKA
jgi:hypothetical protein